MLDRSDTRSATEEPSNSHAQVDQVGQAVLQLLQRAATAAEENHRNALEMAQGLSRQLRDAESRIAELEAENEAYREKAEKAEQWLHRVYTEVRDQLFREPEAKQRKVSSRQ